MEHSSSRACTHTIARHAGMFAYFAARFAGPLTDGGRARVCAVLCVHCHGKALVQRSIRVRMIHAMTHIILALLAKAVI